MIDFALRLYDQGIVTIPVTLPDKRPSKGIKWGEWYKNTPSREEFMQAWQTCAGDGIALLCGDVELLEADVKNDPAHDIHLRLMQALKDNLPDLYEKLYVQQSPSGGYHFWYRVPEGEKHGNMPDLARIEYTPDDRFELELPPTATNIGVIVETRGYGGYALIAPSPGYTPMQGSIENLPVLTSEERDLMIMVGRMFNQFEPQEIIYAPSDHTPTFSGKRPGDVYNAQTGPFELLALLERYGFRRLRQLGDSVFLGRPGAKHAHKHDAKVNLRLNCFVNFSSSVDMFQPMKGYSPYYVYANLVHRGDFKEATRDLAGKGFEDPENRRTSVSEVRRITGGVVLENSDPDSDDPFAEIEEDVFLAEMEKFRFSLDNRPQIQFNLFIHDTGDKSRSYPVAFPGALVAIYGKAKSRKTTVLGLIIASALSQRRVLNVTYNEPGKILWIDTEQGSMFFWETMWRVHVQSRLSKDERDRLFSYSLVDMSPTDRLLQVDKLIKILQPAIVVLDGIIDFMFDMNDLKETAKVISMLRKWNAGGATVFAVLHLNPTKTGDSKARGHIGTFLTNKCDTAIEATPSPNDESIVTVRNTWSRGPKFNAFDLFAGRDGILKLDAQPDYDFTIGKPERQKEEVDTDPDNVPAPAPSVEIFNNNRRTFDENDSLF